MIDLHWSGPKEIQADGLLLMPDYGLIVLWRSLASRFTGYRLVMFDVFNGLYPRWNPDKEYWAFSLS
jgi:hypothetical protein